MDLFYCGSEHVGVVARALQISQKALLPMHFVRETNVE